jgi:hypothetical protein
MIDLRTGSLYFAYGQADVTNEIYTESGTWQRTGHESILFEQQYKAVSTSPTTLTIRFPDSRLFFTLDLRHTHQIFTHHCGHDVYCGVLKAQSFEKFMISWQVEGPRKKYKMLTIWQT